MNNFGKYKDKIKEFASITNKNGIKYIRVITDGGPCI